MHHGHACTCIALNIIDTFCDASLDDTAWATLSSDIKDTERRAFLSVMLQFKTMLYSQGGGDRRVRLNEGRECGVRLEHAVSFVVGIQLLDAANEVRESRKHSEEEDPTSHGIEVWIVTGPSGPQLAPPICELIAS